MSEMKWAQKIHGRTKRPYLVMWEVTFRYLASFDMKLMSFVHVSVTVKHKYTVIYDHPLPKARLKCFKNIILSTANEDHQVLHCRLTATATFSTVIWRNRQFICSFIEQLAHSNSRINLRGRGGDYKYSSLWTPPQTWCVWRVFQHVNNMMSNILWRYM